MSAERGFSVSRWWSIVLKEFLQLRRDRLTFGMIIGIPIMQLLLFGYAINTNPKHLPTAIIAADDSIFTRGVIAALKNSDYFELKRQLPDEAAGREALARGDVLFVLNIPSDFTRRLLHGDRPSLLIEADATDPSSTGLASAAVGGVAQGVISRDLTGPLTSLATGAPAFDIQVHSLYNPENNSQFNIVPGLMGVILTMTMVLMTGLAMTRERERGTMENLLATPVKPVEVVTGKIVPYIAIGLIQSSIILLAARFIFSIPFVGSVLSIYLSALLFIAATLSVGITLSSLAQNQLQAMQMTMFYFLPNILLSGFMFPFQGMPAWARVIGNILPLTHFNRLIRGIVLKGNDWLELWPNIWPMGLFALVMLGIALKFYRRTLD